MQLFLMAKLFGVPIRIFLPPCNSIAKKFMFIICRYRGGYCFKIYYIFFFVFTFNVPTFKTIYQITKKKSSTSWF